jgi:hypothetical protein
VRRCSRKRVEEVLIERSSNGEQIDDLEAAP